MTPQPIPTNVENDKTTSTAAPPDRLLLPQRAMTALRAGWVILTATSLLLFAAGALFNSESIGATIDARALLDLDISLNYYVGYIVGLNLIVLLAHVLISIVIVLRCPDEPMALFLAIALMANGSVLPLSQMYGVSMDTPFLALLANLVIFIGLTSSGALLYLFPTGRFVPSWSWLLLLIWGILAFFTVATPNSILSLTAWPRLLQIPVLMVGAGTGIYAQIYRYEKVSNPIQRQQTKWALIGLSAAVVGPAIWIFGASAVNSGPEVPNILYQRMGASLFTTSLLLRIAGVTLFRLATILFPLSFAIAILRYRLWDIDVLINRTLVYGSLTGALLLLYFLSVLILQIAFRLLTGEGDQLAIVLSTLAIAALFNPLRTRIQAAIDRRFYRRKYDAEKALQNFNARLRSEVDLDHLSSAFLSVVDETMQPLSLTLWLKDSD